jgi:hypothetical protein
MVRVQVRVFDAEDYVSVAHWGSAHVLEALAQLPAAMADPDGQVCIHSDLAYFQSRGRLAALTSKRSSIGVAYRLIVFYDEQARDGLVYFHLEAV